MTSTILNNLDTVAVISAGLFTGAALYIGTTQAPALRALGVDEEWRFFPLMVKKAISLPVLTGTAGLTGVLHGSRIVGATNDRRLWIAAGSVFLAVIPYTLFGMGPVIKAILNKDKRSEVSNDQRKDLLDKWNGLHAVRIVSAAVGFSAMVYGLSRHSFLHLSW